MEVIRHIRDLLRPPYERKLIQIRECVNGAREEQQDMIASLPKEDQWFIIVQRQAALRGESDCTNTRNTRQSESGG
jgi:hypothetical protein